MSTTVVRRHQPYTVTATPRVETHCERSVTFVLSTADSKSRTLKLHATIRKEGVKVVSKDRSDGILRAAFLWHDGKPNMSYCTAAWADAVVIERALAAIAAAERMTTGGEPMCVWANGAPPELKCVPFSVGRGAINVSDGPSSVMTYATRGRDGMYRTTALQTPSGTLTARTLPPGNAVSHPQVLLLRELVSELGMGMVRIAGARVAWSACGGGATFAKEVTLVELAAAIALADPTIAVQINGLSKVQGSA